MQKRSFWAVGLICCVLLGCGKRTAMEDAISKSSVSVSDSIDHGLRNEGIRLQEVIDSVRNWAGHATTVRARMDRKKTSWDLSRDSVAERNDKRMSVVRNVERLVDSTGKTKCILWSSPKIPDNWVLLMPRDLGSFMVYLCQVRSDPGIPQAGGTEFLSVWPEEGFFLVRKADGLSVYISAVDQDFGKGMPRYDTIEAISNVFVLGQNLVVEGRFYYTYCRLRYYAWPLASRASSVAMEQACMVTDLTPGEAHLPLLKPETTIEMVFAMAEGRASCNCPQAEWKPRLDEIPYEFAWMHRGGMFITSPMLWWLD